LIESCVKLIVNKKGKKSDHLVGSFRGVQVREKIGDASKLKAQKAQELVREKAARLSSGKTSIQEKGVRAEIASQMPENCKDFKMTAAEVLSVLQKYEHDF
jgi:hypothetical protein